MMAMITKVVLLVTRMVTIVMMLRCLMAEDAYDDVSED